MSTDKFHIANAQSGNDTHSNFLRRMGYGDLLNRPGRQEMTIDTASMYKQANEPKNNPPAREDNNPGALLGAGVGAMAGGIGGAELVDHFGGSATAKLLGALAGVGVGGIGGYYAGGLLDKVDNKENLSLMELNRSPIGAAGLGALGALTGYGTSKYLLGSKNKTHHVLSALLGAGVGAGAGYLAGGASELANNLKEGMKYAARKGYTGEKAREFANEFAKQKYKNDAKYKGGIFTGLWEGIGDIYTESEQDAVERADDIVNGRPPRKIAWTPTAITAGALGLGYGFARNKEWVGKTQYRNLSKEIYNKTNDAARLGLDSAGNVVGDSSGYRALDELVAKGKFISNRELRRFERTVEAEINRLAGKNPFIRNRLWREFRTKKGLNNLFKQLDNLNRMPKPSRLLRSILSLFRAM